jgi:hypothetical protein
MMNQQPLTTDKRQQIFMELRLSINQLVGAIKGEFEINQADAIRNLNSITCQINHLDDYSIKINEYTSIANG